VQSLGKNILTLFSSGGLKFYFIPVLTLYEAFCRVMDPLARWAERKEGTTRLRSANRPRERQVTAPSNIVREARLVESAKVCRVNHVRETKQAKRKREARSTVSEAFEMGNGEGGATPPSQGQDRPPLLHRGDAKSTRSP
jgi:hypothetical protein